MAILGAVIGDGAQALADVCVSLHADLPALETEWCDFEQRADCTVFQSFGWLSAWHRHIGISKGVRPAIVIGRDAAGALLFLLPLAVEPGRLGRRLTWLGSEMSDYNAPLLAPRFSAVLGAGGFAALWSRILRRIRSEQGLHFQLVHFERMPQRVGGQANPFLELPVVHHASGAYATHLTGDWATFYASCRSSATRRRDRRKLKHLEQLGPVEFVTPRAADERARSFDTLMVQKSRSFAAMGVPNLFRRAGYPEFYRSLALDDGTRRIVHLSRLDVGGAPAAVSIGLCFRKSYYLVLSSYDTGEIARHSPGRAHLHELMRHAIETGCTLFDFTVGDEPYKREWAEGESALFDHVSAARPHAAPIALSLLGGIRLKRAIKRTDVLWRPLSKARALVGRLLSRLAAAAVALAACLPVQGMEFGVNIHHGGTAEFNAQRAALMKDRNFRTARMDYISFRDISALRDQIRRIRANGGSVEVVLWTPFGNDHSCNPDLAAVERSAYDDALQAVQKMKDLVHDYELLNETQQRPEIRAETDHNHMGLSSAPFHGKPCLAALAAGLRGMSRAIHDVRASSGLPLRAILGLAGRDFGFLSFMQEEGVLFDVIGIHPYQEFANASLLDDPWWGTGGPYVQLAKFGRPVHVNEFNCGEIYRDKYENQAGQPLTEQCLRALKKHLTDLLEQQRVTIESVHFYELLDEPEKGRPEGEFGLMYDLDRPKPQLYLYTAFAGGHLTPQERREITTRGLMSDAEIDARRAPSTHPPRGQ